MQEGSLNITTENGKVSVKDTITSKSGRFEGRKQDSVNLRNSGNFSKTNPKERSLSKEVKRELCSSGNPLRMKIKTKDETNSAKNSLERNTG